MNNLIKSFIERNYKAQEEDEIKDEMIFATSNNLFPFLVSNAIRNKLFGKDFLEYLRDNVDELHIQFIGRTFDMINDEDDLPEKLLYLKKAYPEIGDALDEEAINFKDFLKKLKEEINNDRMY